MNNALYRKLRIFFIIWCLSLCGLGYIVFTDTSGTNSFLTHFFSSKPIKPIDNFFRGKFEQPPAPAPIEPSKPEPAKEPEPPKNTNMAYGNIKGSGTLEAPTIRIEGENLILSIPYTGKPGEYTAIDPSNIKSKAIDLHGEWQYRDYNFNPPPNNLIRLIQSANHRNFVRFTAIVNKNVLGLTENIVYSDKEIIITFSPRAN